MPARDKRSQQQQATSRSLPAQQQVKPSWPPFSPTVPVADLGFEVLLRDQILTISNLWPSSLCKKYVSFLAGLPLTTTPSKTKKGEAVRVNDRFQVDDAGFAERLWSETALKELISNPSFDGAVLTDEQKLSLWGGKVLGINSNIRVYRYNKGQFFAQHYDESNNVTFTAADGQTISARTTWTLLLYLTSSVTGCEGGQTVFYPEAISKRSPAPEPIIADLEIGTVLLHRHGADCLLHEGREVTAGEKWVIRSDICVAR